MFSVLYASVYLAFQTNCLGALIQVDEDILNRINKIETENKLALHRIANLKEIIERKEDRIHYLEELVQNNCHVSSYDIEQLDARLKTIETNMKIREKGDKCTEQRNTEDTQTNIGDENEEIDITIEIPDAPITDDDFGVSNTTSAKKTEGRKNNVRRIVEGAIAFTAVLEDPTDVVQHIGLNQVIKYNRIITNVGNSYNIHSGIFTVPINGLYLFHYTASLCCDRERLWVRLMVDSTPQNSAIAVSIQNTQDIQAGNVAILSLRQGQVVWVETFQYNDVHIFASNGFSSFSGVLLSEN